MAYSAWKSLTVRDVIPALDPNTVGSMMDKAQEQANNAKADIQQKQDVLNSTVSTVNDLMNMTQGAVDKLNGVASLVDSSTSINYNRITGTGKTQFVNEVDNALSVTSAPTINTDTEVGAAVLLVTGATSTEVQSKLAEIEDLLEGVK